VKKIETCLVRISGNRFRHLELPSTRCSLFHPFNS
jgi:hypothetical protein